MVTTTTIDLYPHVSSWSPGTPAARVKQIILRVALMNKWSRAENHGYAYGDKI